MGMGQVSRLAKRKLGQTETIGMLEKSLLLPSKGQVEKVLDYFVA